MFDEYPKALYLKGWSDLSAVVTVQNVEEERAVREDGYRMLAEAEEAAAPPQEAADGREALLAALDAAGVDYDRRWGLARLQAALDAAA